MEFYVSEIKHGAPTQFVNDIQRLIYQTLDSRAMEYTRVESDPGVTMEQCRNLDRAFGVDTVKTIVLTNRQKSRFWLYVTHARKQFITKEFSASLGIPRVSFADEEQMQRLIGTVHGAATPLGLIAESAAEVTFVMDRDVAACESIVVTDGDPCGFICLKVADLIKITGKEPILIENPAEIIP